MKVVIGICVACMIFALSAQKSTVELGRINQKLEEEMACEAVKRGLTERGDVQDKLRESRRNILVQALKEDMLRAIPEPTEAEMNACYQQMKNRWIVPETYLIDAVEMSKLTPEEGRLAKGLVTGKEISDDMLKPIISKAVVTQKSGKWLLKKNMALQIWKQLPTMKINEVRIINTPGGAWVVRKGQFRKSGVLPLEKVRNHLKQLIKQQKFDKLWNQYLMQLQLKVLKANQ